MLASMREEAWEILETITEVTGDIFTLSTNWLWRRGEIFIFVKKLKKARTWKSWKAAAEVLDELNGAEDWRKRKESRTYDFELIESRLNRMQELRRQEDVNELVQLIRSGLIRNIGGSLNEGLYENSLIGTKKLIEKYETEVQECLKYLVKASAFPLKRKLEFFCETRFAYGRTALLLSGGATLGMYHLGVIKCLYKQSLLPNILCGTSAGSIVAAMVACTKWEEIPNLFQKGFLSCASFDGLENGAWSRKIKRFFREGHLMDIKILKDFLRENIGDITFEEAYKKTGIVLNIAVSEFSNYNDYRLLNYLTSPHVII